jgi:FkbM family methyltransferase
MNNNELIASLEKCVTRSKGSRIQRFWQAPGRILHTKILDLISPWRKSPVRMKAKTFWDEEIIVVIPEGVSIFIFRYGFFEEGLTRMVLKYLKAGMTFFDIGSHYGYFTLLSSFLVGLEGQVHSFEPTPSTFNILKDNCFNKGNIFLNNYAVSSGRRMIPFNDYGLKYSAFNSICDSRLPVKISKELKPDNYQVEAIPIDEYVEKRGIKPDFIKIDAENAEYEILLGMSKIIDRFHPMISIEVGDLGDKDVRTSQDLINFLINKNYQPYEFKDGEIKKHHIRTEPYQYDNILFLPE